MEGNRSSGNKISATGGSSYGVLDLQGSMRVNHHHPQSGSMVRHSNHENFPLTMQDCDNQNHTISFGDFSKNEKGKSSASDEDEPEDTHDNGNRGKKMSTWHRVKWSDPMVRLLITAVSYVGEDASMEYGGGVRRKSSNLQKKGKWKSVSKAMAERGHFVSPQQCEDKFNDLNKRYKRLNEILGRGTSCEVVENPSLLDLMNHVSDKAKEEVRKILSSKHLYYEEMCSYHNGNRLHLPPDPELQHSLKLALRTRDDHDIINSEKRNSIDELDDEDQYLDMDDHGEYDGSSKRIKQFEGYEINANLNKNFSFQPKNLQNEMNQDLPEGVKANVLKEQWMKHRMVQLEEQKVHILAQSLELEKERFRWQRFCRKKDRELEMMRIENERTKLENEQMVLEIKLKEP